MSSCPNPTATSFPDQAFVNPYHFSAAVFVILATLNKCGPTFKAIYNWEPAAHIATAFFYLFIYFYITSCDLARVDFIRMEGIRDEMYVIVTGLVQGLTTVLRTT